MKIFLMGASGMIGSRILAEAVSRGHSVIAGARDPAKIATLPGVTPVAVVATDADALARYAAQADVYVQSVSPRSTGDAVTEAAGYTAALLAAGKAAGKRVVTVGGAGTLTLPDGTPVIAHVPDFIVPEATGAANQFAALSASDLDWTFFAPAAEIAPGTRTGKFRLGGAVLVSDAAGKSHISAEDYAVAMVDELENPAHRRQIFTIGY